MLSRILAALFLSSFASSIVEAQEIDVGYNSTYAFHDKTNNSTSSGPTPLVPAVTRIHEADSIQFVWQGSVHTIVPYDSTQHSSGYVEPLSANAIMTSTTWDAPSRSSTYKCSVHPMVMTGQIFVYELATKFQVSAPASVMKGAPFTIMISATGTNGSTDGLYAGSVHFTTTDTAPSGVNIPPDYLFTTTDLGTHAFSGLVLQTAGTQSITVTDSASGAIGKATITVVNRNVPNPPTGLTVTVH